MKKGFFETERGGKVLKFAIYGGGALILNGVYWNFVEEAGAMGQLLFFGFLGYLIWAIWGDDLFG